MFEIKVWRGIYDKVQSLGKYLKDSRPDRHGNPPEYTISLEERFKVEEQIKILSAQSGTYLDKCGMKTLIQNGTMTSKTKPHGLHQISLSTVT